MSWPRVSNRLPVSRNILMRMAELLMERAAPRKMRFRLRPAQPVGQFVTQGKHGGHFHQADDHHLQPQLPDSVPTDFQPDAEEEQHQAQFRQHPDGLQILDRALNALQGARVQGAKGKRADNYAGQQVAQNRRQINAPEEHKGDSGHCHGDGKVLNQPDAFVGAS